MINTSFSQTKQPVNAPVSGSVDDPYGIHSKKGNQHTIKDLKLICQGAMDVGTLFVGKISKASQEVLAARSGAVDSATKEAGQAGQAVATNHERIIAKFNSNRQERSANTATQVQTANIPTSSDFKELVEENTTDTTISKIAGTVGKVYGKKAGFLFGTGARSLNHDSSSKHSARDKLLEALADTVIDETTGYLVAGYTGLFIAPAANGANYLGKRVEKRAKVVIIGQVPLEDRNIPVSGPRAEEDIEIYEALKYTEGAGVAAQWPYKGIKWVREGLVGLGKGALDTAGKTARQAVDTGLRIYDPNDHPEGFMEGGGVPFNTLAHLANKVLPKE